MTTLSTIATRARVRTRDQNKHAVSDTELLGIANSLLDRIHKKLCDVESNLVYGETYVTTVDGTAEYALSGFNTDISSDFNGFMDDGVWVDGEDEFLKQASEADKVLYDYGTSENQPEAYYITEDNMVGFLWVPDDAYTIHTQYWKRVTALTATDLTDTLPWYGILDLVIEDMLVLDMLTILERDVSMAAARLVDSWDGAMSRVYARGCRPRRGNNDFFSVEGV